MTTSVKELHLSHTTTGDIFILWDVRVVPELEEMGAYVGERAGRVLPHHLQVFLGHLPHGGAAALKQRRVVEVPLWRRTMQNELQAVSQTAIKHMGEMILNRHS